MIGLIIAAAIAGGPSLEQVCGPSRDIILSSNERIATVANAEARLETSMNRFGFTEKVKPEWRLDCALWVRAETLKYLGKKRFR
jgi:hypothetical protein